MCGIGGCVLRNGAAPSLERLSALRAALSHRGPDGSGTEVFGNVGFVHARLAIVDTTDAARQPMCDRESGWSLNYNGEIYNHLELRRRGGGASLASAGDTATLLRGFVEHGPGYVSRLNGQFALAVLDSARGRLWLTRDRFGIKPLYIAEDDEGLWFASEPQALVACGIRPVWQAGGLQSMLEGSCYSGESTLAAGIRRVAPGVWTSVDVNTGEIAHSTWTRIADSVQRGATGKPGRRRRWTDELENVLRKAVHDSLLADVPIGSLCSGGVDSSLVTAYAAEVKPGLVAFGARHAGDPGLDEGPAARRAAAAIGVELDLLDVTAENWRDGFVESTVHFGAPLPNSSAVVVAQMAARARERGFKVLLTGEGADELFAGYGGLHRAALSRFGSPWARAVRALEPLLVPGPGDNGSIRRRVRALGVRRRTEPTWSSLTSVRDGLVTPVKARAAYRHHPGARGDLEAALLARMDYTLCHLLNRMDKNMMQHSVEARVPFLDPAVLELVLNLPLEVRTGPWSKGILRDVARRTIPREIAHRPKIYGMGFAADRWIEEAADPAFMTEGVLRDVLGLTRAEMSEQVAKAVKATRIRIWSAEVWCRSVLMGESTASIEADLWLNGP